MIFPTAASEIAVAGELDHDQESARRAAYRRLTAVILRLDVASLAAELRKARLETVEITELPLAA
jgi:hypothetical protein